jgi:hypothetical protein
LIFPRVFKEILKILKSSKAASLKTCPFEKGIAQSCQGWNRCKYQDGQQAWGQENPNEFSLLLLERSALHCQLSY